MVLFPFSRFTVSGNSMLPTLNPGQDVLALCWLYKLEVGDVVVVKKNGKEMIKRIQKVHDREYFVEGDNKLESTDSRNFGPIRKDQIIGKVIWYQ